METKEFRTGLSIKYEDIQVNKPAHKVSVGLFQPNLRLVITLKGISDIHFENGHFHQDASAQPKMAFLAINKQEKGWKHFASQKTQEELVVFISADWLKDSIFSESKDFALITTLHQQHLASQPLLATSRVLNLVNDLKQLDMDNSLHLLQAESTLLALLSEAFKQVVVGHSQHNADHIQCFKNRLDQGEFDNSSLSEMAKSCHTNVTSLQRQFQALYHISIGAYLRQKKLERGYDALLQGCSVTSAAEIAGYTNPDNFSAAFRRQFSISPRQLKQERSKLIS
ncbi:hypothetical protein B0188_10725 [[Haemophilus] felis]|uniref:HTH araC/xylS-type domain-containing protein n=1 Tax=[Haemophilus] felis TaxID=123822 RepID=A0A1T0AUI1_9PAST|nr:hypothetical protein B0188_10725 [[Haemophilus] felis]